MDHVGIDVHKRDSQICILAEGGELIEQRIRTELCLVRGRRETDQMDPRGMVTCSSGASVFQAPPFPRNVPTGCGSGCPSCWTRQARIDCFSISR